MGSAVKGCPQWQDDSINNSICSSKQTKCNGRANPITAISQNSTKAKFIGVARCRKESSNWGWSWAQTINVTTQEKGTAIRISSICSSILDRKITIRREWARSRSTGKRRMCLSIHSRNSKRWRGRQKHRSTRAITKRTAAQPIKSMRPLLISASTRPLIVVQKWCQSTINRSSLQSLEFRMTKKLLKLTTRQKSRGRHALKLRQIVLPT